MSLDQAGEWYLDESKGVLSYKPRSGEDMHEAVVRECHAVRNGVGMFDATTLGKIEVYGPGAAELLDRAYAGRYSDLKVGMTRYGLMLDESGVIVDDGVIARLDPELFYFTTTTGGSAAFGHSAAIAPAPEPTRRVRLVIDAMSASRSGAIRGATNVRPPGPNTCR
jgi:glycine cleavage system aminomethyltransferase T